jgi:hypothetical protein
MSKSRWFATALFALAVIGAYHAAKPKPETALTPAPALGNPYIDSLDTESLNYKRGIVVPPEPLKVSTAR